MSCASRLMNRHDGGHACLLPTLRLSLQLCLWFLVPDYVQGFDVL